MSIQSTCTRSNRTVRRIGYILLPVFLVSFVPAASLGGLTDSNGDGYADLVDYIRFQRCFTRSAGGFLPDECTIVDANGDSQLNLRDVGEIQNGFDVSNCPGALFTPESYAPSPPANVSRLELADVDGDGDLDAIVGRTGGIAVFFRDAYGTYRNQESTVAVQTTEYVVSMATGDVDVDGDIDVMVEFSYTAPPRLFTNDGTGRFEVSCLPLVPEDLHVLRFADLNHDGAVELVGLRGDGLYVFPVLGSCQFGDPMVTPMSSFASGFELADFNNDGAIDLVAFDSEYPPMTIWLGIGDGTFAQAGTYNPGVGVPAMDFGDINNDGRLDMVLGAGSTVKLAFGNSDGTFSPAIPIGYPHAVPTYDIDVGDFDGDFILDIAWLGHASLLVTFRGIGDGTFVLSRLFRPGGSLAEVADLNHDGMDDWVSVSAASFLTVLYGNEFADFDAPLSEPSVSFTDSTVVRDLNNDGRDDLITLNEDADSISIFLADETGGFADSIDYPTNDQPFDFVIGDWATDGHVEIVVLHHITSGMRVFRVGGEGELTILMDSPNSKAYTLVGFADMNDDGKDDLVATYGSSIKAYGLNGTTIYSLGYFSTPVDVGYNRRVELANLNADSWVDYIVFSYFPDIWDINAAVGIKENAFQTSYSPFLELTGNSVIFTDLNGDDLHDFVMGMAETHEIRVFIATGDGGFAEPVSYPTVRAVLGLAGGDFNGDGKTDVVVMLGADATSDSRLLLLGDGQGGFAATGQRYGDILTSVTGIFAADTNGDSVDDWLITRSLPSVVLVYPSECTAP